MDSEVSRAVSLYKEITKIPNVFSAFIVSSPSDKYFNVYSLWTSQDFVREKRIQFDRVHSVKKKNLNILPIELPSKRGSVLHCCTVISKSGNRLGHLFKTENPEATFIEIWSPTRQEITVNVTDHKDHGKIHYQDVFGCFKFSSDDKYLLYCAEKKQSKGVSFFKETEKKDDEMSGKGEEYLYTESWGEGFTDVHHSVLCILEVETGKVEVLPIDSLIDSEISVGQAEWGPNDESIVFVAWEELPYRLGIYACMNRRSSICSFDLKTRKVESIRKENNTCVYSPRFSPNFDTLVFLENDSDGPHKKGAKLQKIEWKTKKLSTVVDIIHNPVGDAFPGIYAANLPSRCWSADGNHVIFSSPWRSKNAAVSVNVNNGSVKRIDEDSFGSFSVLDVSDDIIVAVAESPNVEPCLLLGSINEEGTVQEWKFMDKHAARKHPDVKWDIHTLCPPNKNAEFPDLDYEIVVMSPAKTEKNNPMIILPHGGPHGVIAASFFCKLVAFVKLGYIVCIVNYRGSVGFGENNLNSLPGNVGSQDVADVQNAAIYVAEKCNFHIGDVFLYGGSHGGFLGAHLTGQFPKYYKAAVLRNPVIDIGAMISISDIPDWCWVEGGCGTQMDLGSVIDPEHLKAMWEKSPIKYVKNVKTPTLLLLGKKDLRVPMAQGLKYYKILKANHVPVKVFMYDDNHSLFNAPVDGDGFIQTITWLRKYSSQEN